ncbi:hypothetical protein M5K25_008399 [Dendrobium thyrsiflorum]|uniref:Uncharacterized protein n=1 Tax=Dendrobium thyrsiflorum TaxID=117978 RepID=A0ABD0VFA0_DENTH
MGDGGRSLAKAGDFQVGRQQGGGGEGLGQLGEGWARPSGGRGEGVTEGCLDVGGDRGCGPAVDTGEGGVGWEKDQKTRRSKGYQSPEGKLKVLEKEIGQLKIDFEEKISDFQNQFAFIHEKMDGRFAVLENMMNKMLEDKKKPATSKSKETTGSHGRGGNPNPFRGRKNSEVEILEGDYGMPPLEPLSREEFSMGYERRGADFVGRMEEFYHRGADFQGRREEKEVEKLASPTKVENNNRREKKISKLKASSIHKNQNLEADENGYLARESETESADAEEPSFWVPPVGERWDFDDGRDRWESHNTSDQETEATGNTASVMNEVNGSESMELSMCTKRLSIAVGPNSFARRKKKMKKA